MKLHKPFIERWYGDVPGWELGWLPFFHIGYYPGPYGQFFVWLGDLCIWYDRERPEWRWRRGG